MIVGVGASAGGIPALKALFRDMPADAGLTFVIVTHLNPERPSDLRAVLQQYTSLPVVIATHDQRLAPDHVHVMPEGTTLTVMGGRLQLHPVDAATRDRRPIDKFLESLAHDQGEDAVGIILSGGDADGSLGVRAIKAQGGVTLAQCSDDMPPNVPEMPNRAIETGLVDFAIPAADMAAKLVSLAQHRIHLRPVLDETDNKSEELARARVDINELLHRRTGQDFSGFKARTFFRRVHRRMQVEGTASIEAYVAQLEADPKTVDALFRDLLINVTSFFRDESAFSALENGVIPRLFEASPDQSVRVWVPGCATGEEAYSIGMLLFEHMEQRKARSHVQIFATDLDATALGVARLGRYKKSAVAGLSAKRLNQFFEVDGDEYVVTKRLREQCVFAPHNVVADPPFSRLNLISCRNLLIYFDPGWQRRVLRTFHYALRPDAYLLLGSSESIGQFGKLFAATDKTERIFQRRAAEAYRPRLPNMLRSLAFEPPSNASREPTTMSNASLRHSVESQVLDRHAPAHVVVNRAGEILYFSAGTRHHLEAPRGSPSQQILSLVRPELRLDLQAALQTATQTGQSTALTRRISAAESVRVVVEPLRQPIADPSTAEGGRDSLFVVLFQSTLESDPEAAGAEQQVPAIPDQTLAERDLHEARERLQGTIEEYEAALEELKSSNEELASVNEEAQSSNEELEASREEMQSLNEELNTINAELSAKVEELNQASGDLRNLYESTQIATIFLNKSLVIRNFTPASAPLFNLRPSDVGRPLTDLAGVAKFGEMAEEVHRVFATGETIERRLTSEPNGTQYLIRSLPYRASDKAIVGVTVTLIDITKLAEGEARQRALVAELNHRVRNMLAVTISLAENSIPSSSRQDFLKTFTARLYAMARSYMSVTRECWENVGLDEIIRQQVDVFGSDRISISGPVVELTADNAISVGMVIHELTTNAAKYGALSNQTGQVIVGWSVSDSSVRLTWKETGGPAVTPAKGGFGLELIHGQVEYQMGGTVDMRFGEAGLEVVLAIPIHRASRGNDDIGGTP